MTDFLDEKHREITDRLKELQPVVDEYNHLKNAALALADVIGSAVSEATSAAAATVTRRHRRRRPRGSGSAKRAIKAAPAAAAANTPVAAPVKATRRKRGRPPGRKEVGRPPGKVSRPSGRPKARGGRPKGSGTRAAQALSLVRDSRASPFPNSPPRWASKRTTSTACSPASSRKARFARRVAAGTQTRVNISRSTGSPHRPIPPRR